MDKYSILVNNFCELFEVDKGVFNFDELNIKQFKSEGNGLYKKELSQKEFFSIYISKCYYLYNNSNEWLSASFELNQLDELSIKKIKELIILLNHDVNTIGRNNNFHFDYDNFSYFMMNEKNIQIAKPYTFKMESTD